MVVDGITLVADPFATMGVDERVGEELQAAEDVSDVGLEGGVTSVSLAEATDELVDS